MNAKEFINRFFNGNFAKENLYAHLCAGFPLALKYENTLALKLCLHPFCCNAEGLVFSAPKFEVIVIYPTGRIAEYKPVISCEREEKVMITKNQIPLFRNTLGAIYDELDEMLAFFDEHHVVPDVLLQKYAQRIGEQATEIGFESWYGGCDDSNSDN